MEYEININLGNGDFDVIFPTEYDENFKNSIDVIEDLRGRIGQNEDVFFFLVKFAMEKEKDFDFKSLQSLFYSPMIGEKKYFKLCFLKSGDCYLTLNFFYQMMEEEKFSYITISRKKPKCEILYYFYNEKGDKIIIE